MSLSDRNGKQFSESELAASNERFVADLRNKLQDSAIPKLCWQGRSYDTDSDSTYCSALEHSGDADVAMRDTDNNDGDEIFSLSSPISRQDRENWSNVIDSIVNDDDIFPDKDDGWINQTNLNGPVFDITSQGLVTINHPISQDGFSCNPLDSFISTNKITGQESFDLFCQYPINNAFSRQPSPQMQKSLDLFELARPPSVENDGDDVVISPDMFSQSCHSSKHVSMNLHYPPTTTVNMSQDMFSQSCHMNMTDNCTHVSTNILCPETVATNNSPQSFDAAVTTNVIQNLPENLHLNDVVTQSKDIPRQINATSNSKVEQLPVASSPTNILYRRNDCKTSKELSDLQKEFLSTGLALFQNLKITSTESSSEPLSSGGKTQQPKLKIKTKKGKVRRRRRKQVKFQRTKKENIIGESKHGLAKMLDEEEVTRTGTRRSTNPQFMMSRIRKRISDIHEQVRQWIGGWGPPVAMHRAKELLQEVKSLHGQVVAESENLKPQEVRELLQVSEKVKTQLEAALSETENMIESNPCCSCCSCSDDPDASGASVIQDTMEIGQMSSCDEELESQCQTSPFFTLLPPRGTISQELTTAVANAEDICKKLEPEQRKNRTVSFHKQTSEGTTQSSAIQKTKVAFKSSLPCKEIDKAQFENNESPEAVYLDSSDTYLSQEVIQNKDLFGKTKTVHQEANLKTNEFLPKTNDGASNHKTSNTNLTGNDNTVHLDVFKNNQSRDLSRSDKSDQGMNLTTIQDGFKMNNDTVTQSRNASQSSQATGSKKRPHNINDLRTDAKKLNDSTSKKVKQVANENCSMSEASQSQAEFVYSIKRVWLHSPSEFIPNIFLPEGFWDDKDAPIPQDILAALEDW